MSHRPRSTIVGLSAAALVAAGSALVAVPAHAATSTTVTSLADSGPGSLRAAIELANASEPGFMIEFGIAGRIPLASALPAVTNEVDIDASGAPGYSAGGAPVVEIDHDGKAGLVFASGSSGSSLAAVAVTNAGSDGVTIRSSEVLLDGNFIGITPGGVPAGNLGDGVELAAGSSKNMIGENAAEVSGATSNVISDNGGSGIRLVGSTNNTIVANRIGTDPTGQTAIPNDRDGITVTNKSVGNTIGGRVFTDSATGQTNNPTGTKGTVTPVFVVPPLGNQVSGNEENGITISKSSRNNVLNGNFVGTTADGNEALGNGGHGVLIANSDDNTLQGCRFQNEPFVYYNVLSANAREGLRIKNSDGTVVQANFLGVGANNTTLLGNGRNGLLVNGDSADTQVGGVIPLGNVIAGNTRNGIAVQGTASGFTTFNTFGGLLAFKGAAPNGQNGILVTSTGGDNLLRTNVFSGNTGNGVKLGGRATGVTLDPNIIGLNTRGDGLLSNGGNGIVVTDRAHHNTIGGNRRSVIRQNTVSGNDGYGLVIKGKAHHNQVFNTYIGANIQGVHVGSKLPRVGNERGGVLLTGNARKNVLGYNDSNKTSKMISGNDGPGVTMRRGTKDNKVVRNYIGVGRTGRCLVNEGRNVIDQGTGNEVRGNVMCSPSQKDGASPRNGGSSKGLG